MSGGGSDQPAWSDYNVDQGQLASFMQSAHGSTWSDSGAYSPTNKYMNNGKDTIAYDPNNPNGTQYNVNQFMAEFNAWSESNKQTKLNWDNYSKAVEANQGGQGDTTITSGDAVGQRQQLLGALANGGKSPGPGMRSTPAGQVPSMVTDQLAMLGAAAKLNSPTIGSVK